MSLKERAVREFGRFRLDGPQRRLECDGVPVNIAPKVLDALLLLVENTGALVERSTLRDQLWPGQIVEDGTVARVIADLRKALGDMGDERRFIETVPKFGYRFVATVTAVTEVAVESPEQAPPPVPPVAQPVFGRKWVVRASVILLCLAGAGVAIRRIPLHRPAVQSVVILPFQLIGETPDGELLEAGLQDSLTMELSGLSGLAVIKVKPPGADWSEDVAEIGRKHRATFVLAGSIQTTSTRTINLSVRLLDSATGKAVWTQRLEERADDLFLVESRLAKLTVAQLLPALPAVERDHFTRRLPSNAAAYRYYLLGQYYWNKRDGNDYANALDMFSKATEADPSYAPAFVGLADTYLLGQNWRDNGRAKLTAEKALVIDPTLGEAHATLAMIASSYNFDWDTAEKEFQTAIRLSPNYLTAHHWYAEFLTMRGQFALSEAEFGVALNLDPASPIILTDLAQLYNFEREYQRSIQTLDEALKLDPTFSLAHYRKGYAYLLLHRPREAIAEFDAANPNGGGLTGISEKAWAAAVDGRRQDSIQLARQAESDGAINPCVLSATWVELGELERAMQDLQGMYEKRSGGLISLQMNPMFDRLRSFEPFRALLRRMNMN